MTHFEEIRALLKFLGLVESIDKCCPPSPIMTCLGVELNTIALTLSVSPDRLSKLDLPYLFALSRDPKLFYISSC